MKIKASAITVAALLALAVQAANATEAVGYNVVTVPANSDALVSVPFSQDAEGYFTVSTVTDTGVTVADTLEASAYADSYYVRFTSGGSKGMWSTVSGNGTGGFELANDKVLGDVIAGDTFVLYKHHTLGSVFPSKHYGTTFTSSTQIVVPNTSLEAINKAGTGYSYRTTGIGENPAGWYNGFTYADSTIIVPESFVIVRNQSDESIQALVYGDVPSVNVAAIIPTTSNSDDLYLGLFPVDMALGDLGLEGFGQLVVVDNNANGINKAGKGYTYRSTGIDDNPAGWYDGFTYANNTIVPAGSGIILRRSANSSEQVWVMNKPY